MTTPRLSIVIPSYNRARKLDHQLAWAIESIAGNWDECELLVSDNASPDDTPQVCEKWRIQSGGHMRVVRQTSNTGLVRNVLYCIANATGDFVWVVGDDDNILPDTFAWVLDYLRSQSPTGLGYLLLNFRTTNGYDGAIAEAQYLPFEVDKMAAPGRSLFEECATLDELSTMLITANIYSTQIAQAAIRRWPALQDNLAFPIALSGYAAAQGAMYVRAKPSLVYPHHVGSHLATFLNTVFLDIPRAYMHLLEAGYPPTFIRARILQRTSLLVYAMRFPLRFVQALGVYFRANRLK